MTFSYELGRPSLHFVKNHPAAAMPLAATVADYQKHRVKKLKKQGRP
jgi:hypothetical protein